MKPDKTTQVDKTFQPNCPLKEDGHWSKLHNRFSKLFLLLPLHLRPDYISKWCSSLSELKIATVLSSFHVVGLIPALFFPTLPYKHFILIGYLMGSTMSSYFFIIINWHQIFSDSRVTIYHKDEQKSSENP